MIPMIENGAKDARFFILQRGNKTVAVRVINVCARPALIPIVFTIPWNVSAKTIEYANTARKVFAEQAVAGIQAEFFPTDFCHASEYEDAPVYAHMRPIKLKLYPENEPITAINATAGIMALSEDFVIS